MNHEELRRLATEATPGPWEKVGMSYYHFQIHGKGRNGHESERICMTTDAVSNDAPADVREANAAYIAAASPDVVLSLIADLDALRVRLAEVERGLADAALSLETVASLSGRKSYGMPPIETYMETFMEVRAYAAARAGVAREVIDAAVGAQA